MGKEDEGHMKYLAEYAKEHKMGKEGHMKRLGEVCQEDIDHLKEKEKQYGGSWKKRGGVGAFMMLARKWDRIEKELTENHGYDIFKACRENKALRINEIGDLRRYLLLVEAELRNIEGGHFDERARAFEDSDIMNDIQDGPYTK